MEFKHEIIVEAKITIKEFHLNIVEFKHYDYVLSSILKNSVPSEHSGI